MKIVRRPYKDVMDQDRFAFHGRIWIQMVQSTDDPKLLKDVANIIRNFIFDAGMRATGYASVEALKVAARYRCKEHFHSRLGVGQHIVNRIKQGYYKDTPEALRRMYLEVFSACRVHSTTAEENRRLSVIQNDPATRDLSWRQQYRLAGVKLVYTHSHYIIDGVRYMGFSEAELAEMLDVSVYKFRKYYAKNSVK